MRSLLGHTSIWRAARDLKRSLVPFQNAATLPSDQANGALEFVHPPAALERDRPAPWRVRVTNRGPVQWSPAGPYPVRLVARWRTHTGAAFGDPIAVPLPGPAFPGEPLDVAFDLRAPGFVGDFELEVFAAQPGTGPLAGTPAVRVAVPVTEQRQSDIDYYAVYRTADLGENYWWVVGAYPDRATYERSQAERRGMLVKHAGLTPDSRVLDIGCGTGQMADALTGYLSNKGAYAGTDIAPEAMEFCRRTHTRPNFTFRQGGLTTVPFDVKTDGGPFDVAIFFSVFTHTFVDETLLLLLEARRLLGPAGRVVVDVITSPLPERGAGNRGQMAVNPDYFRRLVDAAGFVPHELGRWEWNAHATRIMYRLDSPGSPPIPA